MDLAVVTRAAQLGPIAPSSFEPAGLILRALEQHSRPAIDDAGPPKLSSDI
jgi:hypothetical protein